MKKLLGAGLTLMLVLGLASVSMANTVYMDIGTGGEYDNRYSEDLSQIAVGINVPLDEFKVDCNLTTGTIDHYNDDVDTSSIFLKGGYALVNNKQVRLDVTGGFYNRTLSYEYHDDEISYYSIMLGFDAKLKLDKKAWVDFSYAFSIAPQGEYTKYYYYDHYYDDYYSSYDDIKSISVLNCKFNYLFTRELGASVGYSCETIDVDKYTYKQKFTSGITLGAFFRF